MRIGGIASGFDTEQIVTDLMRAERMPMDRVFQNKVKAEWQRDGYREVNNMLRRLQEKSFDMRLQGSYSAWNPTSSNASVASVTATGRAQEGSFDLKVNQLAEVATFTTNTIDHEAFDSWSGTLRLRSDANGDFVEIEVAEGESLKDVFAKINRHADLGIQAFYDADSGVSLRSRATGKNAVVEFDIADGTTQAFLKDVLNQEVVDENGEVVDENGVLATGENAEVEINGLVITRESNTFEIDGINVTIQAEGTSTIQVSADVDAVYEKIKGFIDMYNEVVTDIRARLNEPVHRDFPPLTEEQRGVMSEREVELWEEKAQSGMLRNDQMLNSILSDLRMVMSSPVSGVDGDLNMLSQIGISTANWYEGGFLHIDENKLKGAIRDNPDQVMQMFTKAAPEGGAASENGIARRLDTSLRAGMDRVTNTAGREANRYDQSFLGNQIRRFEERLNVMEDRMQRVEQRYWNQFTTMERMLSEMHSQSDWLQQQLFTMMG